MPEMPVPPGGPAIPEDPKAARARLLNELALWLSDSILSARQVIEGHFGAAGRPPAPHEMAAVVRAGTVLFQTAVMIQAQQQALQQAAKQIGGGFEPPPELRRAMNEMMKRAPKIIDEILKESREGDEWKKPDEDDDPPPPPRKRRHPEDEPPEDGPPNYA